MHRESGTATASPEPDIGYGYGRGDRKLGEGCRKGESFTVERGYVIPNSLEQPSCFGNLEYAMLLISSLLVFDSVSLITGYHSNRRKGER